MNHNKKGKYRFVIETGVHTNHAESAHSSVKRAIRKQGRLSMLPQKADKVASLCTLFFKKTSWQERFQALLKALKSVKNMEESQKHHLRKKVKKETRTGI